MRKNMASIWTWSGKSKRIAEGGRGQEKRCEKLKYVAAIRRYWAASATVYRRKLREARRMKVGEGGREGGVGEEKVVGRGDGNRADIICESF